MVEADEPNPSTDSLTSGEQVTCYGYTPAGQLAWVHQDVQQSQYQERALAYDGLGRVLYSRFPESAANISGPMVDGGSNWSESITYDSNGNPTGHADANGATESATYDGLNRLTAESFSGGVSTPSLSFHYDSTSGCTVPNGASPANLAGRLVCATSSNGTYTLYSYDPAGDVTDIWDQAPDVLAHQNYGYYFNGQLASYTNPEGDTFTYSIDSPGRITQIVAGSSWNGGETLFSQDNYDAPGALIDASLGNAAMSIMRDLNNRLEPEEITAAVSGTTRFDRQYGFDADALPTSLTDNVNSAYDQTYAYDSLGRLTGLNVTNNSSNSATYSYDVFGNLFNASGPENWAATFNAQTNRISDSGFVYDNNGNLTSDGSNSYTWNDAGQMTMADNTNLYFDALGRRDKSVTSSESDDYIYSFDGSLAAVYNATAGAWKTFEFSLNGTPIETYDVNPPSGYSNYTYSVTDLVGSPALRVNSTAGSNTYSYLPYGYNWPGQSSDPTTTIGFTGDESEPGTGLDHALARDYAPFEKRWLSADSVGWAVASTGSPQSWDRYTYVGANPLGAIDPSGMCGNLVIGGSAQNPNDINSQGENAFAASLGANAIFPFAGESIVGSLASIEEAANLGLGNPVDTVRNAIAAQAAAGPGNFTLYGFSGGAQLIQTALSQLGPAIASRAVVVGISPGYGLTQLPQLPYNALTVWGGLGQQDPAVAATAILNDIISNQLLVTGCLHDANCEFGAAWSTLSEFASAACPPAAPSSPAAGGGNGATGGGGGNGATGGGATGDTYGNPFGPIDMGGGAPVPAGGGTLVCSTFNGVTHCTYKK